MCRNLQRCVERVRDAHGCNRSVAKSDLSRDRGGRTCGGDRILTACIQGKNEMVAMDRNCRWCFGGWVAVYIADRIQKSNMRKIIAKVF